MRFRYTPDRHRQRRHARTVPHSKNGRQKRKHKPTVMSSSYEDSEQRDDTSDQDDHEEELRIKLVYNKAAEALNKLRERSEAKTKRLQRKQKQLKQTKGRRSCSPPPPSSPTHRNRTAPLGFTRSTCRLNHSCGNPQCYTSLRNPQVLWDRSKYAKPYYPHRKAVQK